MPTEPPSPTKSLLSPGLSSHNRAPSPTPYREGSGEAHPGSAVSADDSRARLQHLFPGLGYTNTINTTTNNKGKGISWD